MSARLPICPPWCGVEHALVLDDDDLRAHHAEILSVPTVSSPQSRATIHVTVYDDLATGMRGGPVVDVAVDDGLTPDTARTMAFALLEAAALAETAGVSR